MSTLMELTVVLLICPAALATWADARYPKLRPREIRRTTIHLGMTGLIAFVAMKPLLGEIFHAPVRPRRTSHRALHLLHRHHVLPDGVAVGHAARDRDRAHPPLTHT